ncbi:MAG: DNA-3-methyladenine glycosylase I, partial [Gemmatimonadetes bacterium]|nr:DNA-3-methyladenine glycosylase I [Gemmatimonadota bacterium]
MPHRVSQASNPGKDLHLRSPRRKDGRPIASRAGACGARRSSVAFACCGNACSRAAAPVRRRSTVDGAVRNGAGSTGGPGVIVRCSWAGTRDDMCAYHDEEWGVPIHDDRLHFEFLTLEGAQAGLSWETILRKRHGYRAAFAEFDPDEVARFGDARQQALMLDPGIVRNRLKIRSTVSNARAFLDVQREFGSFDAYIWGFTDGRSIQNSWRELSQLPAETAE